MVTSPASGSRPYLGPRPYDAADAAWFFGREHEARRLAALWCDNRVTLLFGDSGTGKTSLLKAGVLPLLDTAHVDILPTGRVTNASVFPAPALFEYNRLVLALLSSLAQAESPSRLSGMSISSFLRRRRNPAAGKRALLAIDQAEELFQTGSDHDREQFLDQLAEALEDQPQLHLLLIIRQSWLSAVLKDKRLTVDGKMALGPLGRDAAVEAIERPAALAGRPFSSDAADALAQQLVDPPSAGEPATVSNGNEEIVQPVILQVVCSALWDELPASVECVTAAHVLGLVDSDNSLAAFIGSRIIAVAYHYNLRPSQLHARLTGLLGTRAGARTPGRRKLSDQQDWGRILSRLEDDYIVRSQSRKGSRSFSLISERLALPLQLAIHNVQSLPARSAGVFSRGLEEWLRDAVRAISDGEFDIAGRLIEYVLDGSSGNDLRLRAQAYTLLGNLAFYRDDAEGAGQHYLTSAEFFEALQDYLEVGRLLAAIGRLNLLNGDAPAAITALYSAVSRLPADSSIMLDLALAFANVGQAPAAVAMLETALATDSEVDAQAARLVRGEILADFGDAAAALRELESVSHRQPLSARAARALSLARLGKVEDADEGIGEALEAGRDNGPVLLRAAQIRALRGDAPGAERYLRKAIHAGTPRLSQYHRRKADSLLEECRI
jgi:tetratricopeptide (TPR) repeat protein